MLRGGHPDEVGGEQQDQDPEDSEADTRRSQHPAGPGAAEVRRGRFLLALGRSGPAGGVTREVGLEPVFQFMLEFLLEILFLLEIPRTFLLRPLFEHSHTHVLVPGCRFGHGRLRPRWCRPVSAVGRGGRAVRAREAGQDGLCSTGGRTSRHGSADAPNVQSPAPSALPTMPPTSSSGSSHRATCEIPPLSRPAIGRGVPPATRGRLTPLPSGGAATTGASTGVLVPGAGCSEEEGGGGSLPRCARTSAAALRVCARMLDGSGTYPSGSRPGLSPGRWPVPAAWSKNRAIFSAFALPTPL